MDGDDARVVAESALVPRDHAVEVGEDLEVVAEVRVERVEHVVDLRVAHEHDLEVHRDRLGLEGRHAPRHRELRRDHLDRAGPERADEDLPRAGLGEEVACVEDHEAAVGAEERSRADHHLRREHVVVRVERAVDRADQRLHGRSVLDHRGARIVGLVVEHDVDAVALGERGVLGQLGKLGREDVVHDAVQEGLDALALEAGAEPADGLLEEGPGLLLDDRLQRLHLAPVDRLDLLPHLLESLAVNPDLLTQPSDVRVGEGAFGAQCLEALGRGGLPVDERHDRLPRDGRHLHHHHRQAGLAQLRLERLGDGLDLLGRPPLDLVAAVLDPVGRERLGEVLADEPDQVVHRAPEVVGLAARQGDEAGAIGLVEVVDVAAIGGERTRRLDRLEQAPQQGGASGAADAAHVDVLPRCVDGEAELQRIDRVVLAHDAAGRLDLGRGLEVEVRGVTDPSKLMGLQGRLSIALPLVGNERVVHAHGLPRGRGL